ncbi:S-4TM family putative pore-forming effector [Sporolactobacillus pectinivorans]|uniref:S-4TM family putative pore-forming effector n=1 Tax=Sporolactobacillus pectinivorans TaxID=1591408 RepID=UPI000C2660AA|nr:S-4TM family putative pore-forming effector [Sporolactobacillus pectinivorans]
MFENQNSEGNIELLKAMRYCYNKAKMFSTARLSVSVIIPIMSIACYLVYQSSKFIYLSNSGLWFSAVGSIWVLLAYGLDVYEKKYILKGTKIQEMFDISLFKLQWNKVLAGSQIPPEEIKEYSSSFKGNSNKLKDWYGGVSSNHFYANVLLAQRSNLMWAISLKRNFSKLVYAASIIYLICSVLLGIFTQMILQDYILKVLLPSISVLLYGFKTTNELNDQCKKIDTLGAGIIELFYDNKLDLINKHTCRKYQDAIFIFNRLQAILIPDWLYWLRQKKDDEKMIRVNQDLSIKSNLF